MKKDGMTFGRYIKEKRESLGKSLRSVAADIGMAPAFAADFPPVAHKFNQRTFHVRLINLCTTNKKSSHKIRNKEIPRVYRRYKGGELS